MCDQYLFTIRIKSLCNKSSVDLNSISKDGNDNDNNNVHQDKF